MKSRRFTFRLPPDLVAQVEAELARYERTRRAAPFTISDFVRRAIIRDLDHARRGRRKPSLSDTPPAFAKRRAA